MWCVSTVPAPTVQGVALPGDEGDAGDEAGAARAILIVQDS